eukprot:gene7163-9766_t
MSGLVDMMRKNIEVMNKIEGFDVIIVCCSSLKQADYWQHRLEQGKGSIIPPSTAVLSVEEDWPGGAGNALGTLYAFTKAAKLAAEKYGLDILTDLTSSKISIGLYHTAGKGTRLAPLPGSENNNKPGVKLPANIQIGGKLSSVTILEAVIKQTSCYAKSRLGRLSVFWGDQVFIPTVSVEYISLHHVDILCTLGPMMSETEWKEKGMDKYGLIAQSAHGAAQVEKVDHATAVQLLAHIGEINSVGASLGSFSVSHFMLSALLNEFENELSAKKGKLDTDPHLWMPMTLDKPAYLQLMTQKGAKPEESSLHFDRIANMMAKFNANLNSSSPSLGLFGPVDVGQGVYWWDYGQLKLFYRNTLLLTEKNEEAELMRLFLGIPESLVLDSTVTNTVIDNNSCLISSSIGSISSPTTGFVRNSILSNVRCKYIEAENCVLINVTADRIVLKSHNIVYNVVEHVPGLLCLEEKQVVVGVFDSEGAQYIIRSHLDIDGGKAWETCLDGNHLSFEQVYNENSTADPKALHPIITAAHDNKWISLS